MQADSPHSPSAQRASTTPAAGWCVLTPPRTDRPGADILEPDTGLETYQEGLDAVNSFFPDRVVPRYDILEFVQKRKARAAFKLSSF